MDAYKENINALISYFLENRLSFNKESLDLLWEEIKDIEYKCNVQPDFIDISDEDFPIFTGYINSNFALEIFLDHNLTEKEISRLVWHPHTSICEISKFRINPRFYPMEVTIKNVRILYNGKFDTITKVDKLITLMADLDSYTFGADPSDDSNYTPGMHDYV